ncbi:hypothetical protein ISCGN_012104 [Ixodes scapularis]
MALLWVDDLKLWPKIQRSFIYEYMITRQDIDGKASQNFKGFVEALNLLDSGHVGTILSHGCHSGELLCGPCKSFYEANVALTAAAIASLEEQAWGQGSSQWQTARKLRITASTAGSIPKTAFPEKWIASRLNSTFRGNENTRNADGREELPENQGSDLALGRLANAEVARGAAAVAPIAQIGLRRPHDRSSGDGVTRQVPPGGRRGEAPVEEHNSPWGDHLGAGREMVRQGRKAGSSLDQVDREASSKHSSVGRPSRARLRGPRGSSGEHHNPHGTRQSCSSMGRLYGGRGAFFPAYACGVSGRACGKAITATAT